MGREIRKVPADWEHPKDSNGKYIPMFNEFYGDVLNDWLKQHRLWMKSKHPDQLNYPDDTKDITFYAGWSGNPPDIESYLTKKYTKEELTHIQLYETTSEGTPVTPVFRADELEKLCEYAAHNCTTFGNATATKEKWMEMLGEGLVYHQEGNNIFI